MPSVYIVDCIILYLPEQDKKMMTIPRAGKLMLVTQAPLKAREFFPIIRSRNRVGNNFVANDPFFKCGDDLENEIRLLSKEMVLYQPARMPWLQQC
jgi:hypothetical protein